MTTLRAKVDITAEYLWSDEWTDDRAKLDEVIIPAGSVIEAEFESWLSDDTAVYVIPDGDLELSTVLSDEFEEVQPA